MTPTPSRRGPTLWIGLGVLVLLLGACWSLAVPLMASPDEPSHVVKAAAVARGQWSGELGPEPTDTSRPGAATVVQLPTDYAAALGLPNCFAFQPDVPAACQQDVAPAADGLVPVETFAGQYPPLYYLLVGWPSLFLGAEAAGFGMRLVSAAVTAALLTWGTFRLHRTFGPPATWGALVAVTPMTLFLGATVNPQALEVAAAFSFWAACLALTAGRGAPTTAAMVQAAVSGALLVNVRTSSPLWALVVVVVALVAARPGRWREVLGHPTARWVGATAGVASVAAVAWIALHPAVVTGGGLHPEYGDLRRTVLGITGRTFDYLVNMVGNFGWLDAPVPPLTVAAWSLGTGALLLLALAVPVPGRGPMALLLLVAAVLLAPFALQVPTATDVGLIWQGRYALPIAVGIPLLAAALLSGTTPEVRTVASRAARVTLPLLLAGHVGAFYWASRRYAEGLDGDVVTLTPDWSSPIGFLPGVALYTVLASAVALLAWAALRPEVPDARTIERPRTDDPAAAPHPTRADLPA